MHERPTPVDPLTPSPSYERPDPAELEDEADRLYETYVRPLEQEHRHDSVNGRLVSANPPYLPILVQIRQTSRRLEALLDTGFDGDLVVPVAMRASLGRPDHFGRFRLADGPRALADAYAGEVNFGPLGSFPAEIVALGDECLMGRGLADRFSILLDHGRQIIVES
jgi:predicted aspartyl protease